MKHMKKTIALFLAVLMTLSLFSVIGFAENETEPEAGTGYTVNFYNRGMDLTIQEPEKVIFTGHSNPDGSVTDPFAGKTKKEIRETKKLLYPDNLKREYQYSEFLGWDQDLKNITKDTNVYPHFGKVSKQYKIVYHDYDGQVLNKADGSLSQELCLYGDHLAQTPSLTRKDDNQFFYEHVGWSLKKNADPTVNKNDSNYLVYWKIGSPLYFPSGINADYDEKSPEFVDLYGNADNPYDPITVNVYAYYTHYNKEYKLSLTVNDAYKTPVNQAAVQVRDAYGQLMKQTFAEVDENGKITNKPAVGYTNEKGEISMRLPYTAEYTIEVSHTDYGSITKKATISDLAKGITVTLTPASAATPRCNCICHSFIGGLWITALNLMHSLFKIRHVCCSDMFATHGDRLNYV